MRPLIAQDAIVHGEQHLVAPVGAPEHHRGMLHHSEIEAASRSGIEVADRIVCEDEVPQRPKGSIEPYPHLEAHVPAEVQGLRIAAIDIGRLAVEPQHSAPAVELFQVFGLDDLSVIAVSAQIFCRFAGVLVEGIVQHKRIVHD